ncbi:MAG: IPT/TIG domain-containing protein, partial [Solirubrobacteraceae bacterium]
MLALVACGAVWLFALAGTARAQGVTGYAEVESSPFTVEVGASTTGTASCPDGDVVLGGGYSLSGGAASAVNITQSAPTLDGSISTNTWSVTAYEDADETATLTVYAVCVSSAISGYADPSTPYTVDSDAVAPDTQTCGAGDLIVGGGFSLPNDTDDAADVEESDPSSNSTVSSTTWTAFIDNANNPDSIEMTVYAVCVSASLSDYSERLAQSDNAGTQTATCPAGSVVLGGGESGLGPVADAPLGLSPTGALVFSSTSWSVTDNSPDGGAVDAIAICAPGVALGISWSGPIALDNTGLGGVSCPSATQCTAVDSDGQEVTFNPTAPGPVSPAEIDQPYDMDGIGCPATNECSAVGYEADPSASEVEFDPGNPQNPTYPTSIDSYTLYGVSCPSPTQCTAVGNGEDAQGSVYTFDPVDPGALTGTDVEGATYHYLAAVACPSVSQCTAVDDDGNEFTFNPSDPGGAVEDQIDGTNGLAAVSCPLTTQCTAVDDDGNEVTFDLNPETFGVTSASAADIDGANVLNGVACPSSTDCVAVDDVGQAVQGNPKSAAAWTLEPISEANSLESISCFSIDECVTVDSNGNGFLGTIPPVVSAVSPAAGPVTGDTTVTITGSGLSNATAVRFGSVAASYVVNSDTSITATSPAGSAGSVDVTVVTAGGTSQTSAVDKFTYVAAPTVSHVSPSAGPTGGGTGVTITGTNLTGATAVRFGLTAATTFAVTSATSITATSPAGSAGSVDVTVTTPGGTSATSSTDKFTYVASSTVNPPTVSQVSPSAGPTGGGTGVTITGTNLTGATAVRFGLTAATAFAVTGATSITATSPAGSAGSVDVTVTTPGGTSATSSTDTFTYVASSTVNPPTVSQVSPSAGPTGGGTGVTITGTNLTGATAVRFGLTAATTFAVTSATSITASSPAGSAGTVDITVTTPGGTSATSSTDTFT